MQSKDADGMVNSVDTDQTAQGWHSFHVCTKFQIPFLCSWCSVANGLCALCEFNDRCGLCLCCGPTILWGLCPRCVWCCNNLLCAIISAGLRGLASLFNLLMVGCKASCDRLLATKGALRPPFCPAVIDCLSKSLIAAPFVGFDGVVFCSFCGCGSSRSGTICTLSCDLLAGLSLCSFSTCGSSMSGTTCRVPVQGDLALLFENKDHYTRS